MEDLDEPQDSVSRIADLLDYVRQLDRLIEVHQQQPGSGLMLSQYKEMQSESLTELKQLLRDFHIDARISGMAA